jgi:hypothetical protein
MKLKALYAKFDYDPTGIELPVLYLDITGDYFVVMCRYEDTCDVFMRTADRSALEMQFGIVREDGKRFLFRGYVQTTRSLVFPVPEQMCYRIWMAGPLVPVEMP